jgi:hypothetical protein
MNGTDFRMLPRADQSAAPADACAGEHLDRRADRVMARKKSFGPRNTRMDTERFFVGVFPFRSLPGIPWADLPILPCLIGDRTLSDRRSYPVSSFRERGEARSSRRADRDSPRRSRRARRAGGSFLRNSVSSVTSVVSPAFHQFGEQKAVTVSQPGRRTALSDKRSYPVASFRGRGEARSSRVADRDSPRRSRRARRASGSFFRNSVSSVTSVVSPVFPRLGA